MVPNFEWQDSVSLVPMYVLIGLYLAIMAILKLRNKLPRNTKIFFAILLTVILTVFLPVKIHGEEIKIGSDRISGRYPFHSFDVQAGEISAIRSSQALRGGNTASLYLKDGGSFQIPMVHGTRSAEYAEAIARFCSANHVTLEWAPDKKTLR
jgi:hypothetical protein